MADEQKPPPPYSQVFPPINVSYPCRQQQDAQYTHYPILPGTTPEHPSYPPQYPYAQGVNPQPQSYSTHPSSAFEMSPYPQPQMQFVDPPQLQHKQLNTHKVDLLKQSDQLGPYLSFTEAIFLSCFVFWCCGWIFGLIAFILAMMGQNSSSNGDDGSARQLLHASYGISIAGMVVGVIFIIMFAVVVHINGREQYGGRENNN